MNIQVGDTYKLFYGDNNINNIKKIHILAIVDDYMIIYKFWGKRSWAYKVEYEYKFESGIESGFITKTN